MPEDRIFTLKDFYFDLPERLIAQYPVESREQSRLLVFKRDTEKIEHTSFSHIGQYLLPGDVLVLNNAKVIPARINFKRESKGIVEIVLNRKLSVKRWMVISNRTKRLKNGEVLVSDIDPDISIRIIRRVDENLEIESNTELSDEILVKIGKIPLPPYINRETEETDAERYQTVYSEPGVAAAAPTAGLHFTEKLLNGINEKGVVILTLTLGVSWGTFKPVREKVISRHKMETEEFDLPPDTANMINTARNDGRRIIAVGTTSLRVLESTFVNGQNIPGKGETDIFIYPPYKIKSTNALITNFHTPYSTLLMLVSAFAGYDRIMKIYKLAVDKKYRFFSYGDAMFIS